MGMQRMRSGWVAGALALALWCVNGPVAAQALDGSVMDAAVRQELNALAPSATYGAFVHFSQGTRAEQDALLAAHNMVIVKDFRKYAPSVFVQAPASAFHAIAEHGWVTYIEHNTPLRYLGDTQSWATRVRVAQESVSGGPYYADAAKTQILDGTGVSLGIIDSGVFGAHPDFADNLLYNFKLVNPTSLTRLAGDPVTAQAPGYIEIGKQDSESQIGGHGTHVTGTVGGSGAASNGTYTGAAPGADLIHWGNGAGLLVLDTSAAYVDMLERLDNLPNNPGFENLVAVNNSYGSDPAPHNPNSTASQLTNQIVARNVVMAFAAGNDGGDGTDAMTSPACRNPTPGVICVASYNDGGTGRREASLSSFSSRGKKGDATTESFPDISAPGDTITSTCLQGLPSQAVCTTGAETNWQPYYGTISGTSMATPHIVGIIGVIQQAYKGKHGKFMTPAQVEEVIQRTAIRLGDRGEYVADPQAGNAFAGVGHSQTHFAWGAGLVDVPSILDALEIAKAGPGSAGEPFVIFDGDVDSGTASDVVALTMQDRSVDGVNGIDHIIRLADGGTLVSGTRYTIERNVAGQAHTTTVVVVADGNVVAASGDESNSAPASLVQLIGNDLHVFVSSVAMGAPAVGEPVHNIRVVVRDASGVPLDFAPSPGDSTNPAIDALRPMFGRAFTVSLLGELDPLVACEAPGLRILSDGRGDIFALIAGQPENPAVPFYDLRELSIIQPDFDAGTDYSMTFRLKMEGFPIVPTGTWPINFCSPAFDCLNPDVNTAAYGADNKYYTVEMTTDPTKGASPAAPAFLVRQPTATGITVGSRTVVPARSGSVDPDGTILIEVLASDIGLTPGGAGTEVLSKFQSRVTPAATTPDNMPDGLAGEGEYRTLAPGACSAGSGNTVPVAENGSATVAHDTATEITLVASDDDVGDSLTYSIVSGPANGSLGTVSGNKVTYTPAAGYSGSDSFSFKANDGTADSNVATVSITVEASNNGGGGEPNNGTLNAELSVSTTSGSLTVVFDASASRYQENADPIHAPVEYNFVFGDGQQSGFQGSAEVSHTYTAAGQYTAYVIVRDGHGQSAVSESKPFELQQVISVGPNGGENQSRFTVDNASGPAPLQVTFDASPSVTADGWEITSYAWDFDVDDNGFQPQASGKVVTHVYTEAGNYTPRLLVTYTKTGTTETQTKSASAVVKATAPDSTPPAANPPTDPPTNQLTLRSSGGGSLGWLLLGPLMLLGLRRRLAKS